MQDGSASSYEGLKQKRREEIKTILKEFSKFL